MPSSKFGTARSGSPSSLKSPTPVSVGLPPTDVVAPAGEVAEQRVGVPDDLDVVVALVRHRDVVAGAVVEVGDRDAAGGAPTVTVSPPGPAALRRSRREGRIPGRRVAVVGGDRAVLAVRDRQVGIRVGRRERRHRERDRAVDPGGDGLAEGEAAAAAVHEDPHVVDRAFDRSDRQVVVAVTVEVGGVDALGSVAHVDRAAGRLGEGPVAVPEQDGDGVAAVVRDREIGDPRRRRSCRRPDGAARRPRCAGSPAPGRTSRAAGRAQGSP